MDIEKDELRPLSEELSGADYGDLRLSRRVGKLVDAFASRPGESIPEAVVELAELEGAYRFLRNESVTCEKTLAPHIEATRERIFASDLPVVVIHDTTEFSFSSEREDMGWLRWSEEKKSCGFYGHFSLAVALSARGKRPLGVVCLETWTRTEPPRKNAKRDRNNPQKEFLRWSRSVDATDGLLGDRIIHVCDSEADDYELFDSLSRQNQRFVIRSRYDRIIAGGTREVHDLLSDVLQPLRGVCEREINLSKREKRELPKANRTHPPRLNRAAKLEFCATTCQIRRPCNKTSPLPPTVQLNIVHVREMDAPSGEEPVEWTLATSEPIQTKEQVEQIVDYYCARWTIEEYFKSLKTGCAFEKKQLESMQTLLNALAICIPVAWRLLVLRSLSQTEPELPATMALNKVQIKILRARSRGKLSESPGLADAMLAVAALGGHIKNNGRPGWQVLGRGFRKLLLLEEGWLEAIAAERCDQS